MNIIKSLSWMRAAIFAGLILSRNTGSYEISCSGNLPLSQYEALQALYNATDGPNWCYKGTGMNWTFSSPPTSNAPCIDNWYGVTCECNAETLAFSVRNLNLTGFCLTGSIPATIGNLVNLENLLLGSNSLNKTIPSTIQMLTNIIVLDLSSNILSGTIPQSLYLLRTLTVCQLQMNKLAGELSTNISMLSGLNLLALSGNRLFGSIPIEVGLLTNLEFLALAENYFSGPIPSNIGSLVNLESLDLSSNILSGSIPESIGKLSSVINIQLFSNKLNGSIPDQLGSLIALQYLDLSENSLMGTIPLSFGNLRNLNVLFIYKNNLSGQINVILNNMNSLLEFAANNNFFSGTISTSIVNLVSLNALNIQYNKFNGQLPSTIGNQVKYLTLSYNSFTGSIPPGILVPSLLTFDVSNNPLNGTIPRDIEKLVNVEQFYMYGTHLTGSLPPEIGQLTSLLHLDIFYTNINGSLPPEIGNLSSMTAAYLYNNYLTGPIPEEISGLASILFLDLANNDLSGSIPASIGNLTTLQYLFLLSNKISGTIPSSIGYLVNLEQLLLDNNRLRGEIPSEIGNLRQLNIFRTQNNHLSGTLPPSIGNLGKITTLTMSNNAFCGTLPSELSRITSIETLYLENNFFSGSIFHIIENFSLLTRLDFASNMFTGKLPELSLSRLGFLVIFLQYNYFSGRYPSEILTNLELIILDIGNNLMTGRVDSLFPRKLQYLYIYSNFFTSTIPTNLFASPPLIALWAHYNYFTGKIPENISNTTTLSQLTLNNNMFSGPFFDLFPSSNSSLEVVDISNNLLSGTISSSIFSLPLLSAISAVQNCFNGQLPDVFCGGNIILQVVNFDGVGSARGCDPNEDIYSKLPSVVGGNFAALGIGGQIPDCLLTLPLLSTLHLSGNNLRGTIPAIDENSSLLIDLALSNNYLSGTIPESIQRHNFQTLELSNNRLHGTLVEDFSILPSQKSLSLGVNRLSGKLPETFRGLSVAIPSEPSAPISQEAFANLTLNILVNNIFECTNSDIPSLDKYSQSYLCGSQELNVSIYVWLVAGGLSLISTLVGLCFWKKAKQQKQWTFWEGMLSQKYYRISQYLLETNANPSISSFGVPSSFHTNNEFSNLSNLTETKAFLITAKIIWVWTMIVLAIVVVTFGVFEIMSNLGSSIVTYQYGYSFSVTFLHGLAPVLYVGLTIFSLLVVAAISVRALIPNFSRFHGHKTSPSDTRRSLTFRTQKYSLLLVLHSINLIVTVAVNTAYVNAILSDSQIDRTQLLLIQISVGLFKLSWNALYIPWCSRFLFSYMSVPRSLENRYVMAITNFIIAPCIATLIVNQACFYFVFKPHNTISSDVTINLCDLPAPCTNNNAQTIDFDSSFVPPFQYSYACGSALLVAYVPVLLYTYVANSFGIPAWRYVVTMNPVIVKTSKFLVNSICTFFKRDSIARVHGRDVVLILMLHCTILLTFGLASPVLGLAAISAIVLDIVSIKIKLGKCLETIMESDSFSGGQGMRVSQLAISSSILKLAPEDKRRLIALEGLSLEYRDMKDAWRGLFACFYLVVIVVSIFWAALFFDMIADGYGVYPGLLTTVCFGCGVPLFVLAALPGIRISPKTAKALDDLFYKLFDLEVLRTAQYPSSEVESANISILNAAESFRSTKFSFFGPRVSNPIINEENHLSFVEMKTMAEDES